MTRRGDGRAEGEGASRRHVRVTHSRIRARFPLLRGSISPARGDVEGRGLARDPGVVRSRLTWKSAKRINRRKSRDCLRGGKFLYRGC